MQTVKKDEKRRIKDKTKEDVALRNVTERSAIVSARRNVDGGNMRDKYKNESIRYGDDRLTKERSKDTGSSRKTEETNKKSIYTVSTPRNFMQKTTTADIYDKNKTLKASKTILSNVASTTNTVMGPQRNEDSLKPTASVPLRARKVLSKTDIIKPLRSTHKVDPTQKAKKTLPMNLTVNSPIQKRKLEEKLRNGDKDNIKIKERKEKEDTSIERPRTKTRTLDEGEVKILTPEIVDNNSEMANLSKKLTAAPKAFYVNLNKDGEEKKHSSEDEVSYEDDFESYESDFESYESTSSDTASKSAQSEEDDVHDEEHDENSKEERMLDSGHFDLRDTRSANKTTPMDYITETSEEADKKTSLTDEGFQEMSSSSGLPSIKTVHVDVFERPLFIDFTKSRDNRRKRRVFERLKQRAQDILSIVTLHEITYSLFEMKPIPYDLFMSTFGRSNYTQTASQTYDDGISTEVQTEEIDYDNKWTQHPVKFSKSDVCLNLKEDVEYAKKKEEFSFLFDEDKIETKPKSDYKNDNLKIYLEQKDGAGSDKIMSHEQYTNKLKYKDINIKNLATFLKKAGKRVINELSGTSGTAHASDLKQSPYPFSTGYLAVAMDKINNDKFSYLKNCNVIGIVFSKSKSNLIFTIHSKTSSGVTADKCILCLWDFSMVMIEPVKVLIAVDNVELGVFPGSIDGFFIGALEDGSIHIWDLTEAPTWCKEDADETQSKNFHEIEEDNLSETERDRRWNLKNRDIGLDQNISKTFLTSAFTTSAVNISHQDEADTVVALEYLEELLPDSDATTQKILGQLFVLQRLGILTVWSVVQEKSKKYVHDPGKAYWSKVKLEKRKVVNLCDHIYERITDGAIFNLNSAKKRLAAKRMERNLKTEPRPSTSQQLDRPTSAAILKKSKSLTENILDYKTSCNDLKIMHYENRVYYLIAKNYGQVLCCSRIISAVKVDSFDVGTAASSVTSIAVSPHGLPYFLAATDNGHINLCSFNTLRVLLKLDCCNIQPSTAVSDSTFGKVEESIRTVLWSPTDPCCITAMLDRSVCVWRLTRSDVYAECVRVPARACAVSDKAFALLSTENEVQIHKLCENNDVGLFQAYVDRL